MAGLHALAELVVETPAQRVPSTCNGLDLEIIAGDVMIEAVYDADEGWAIRATHVARAAAS